MEVDGERSDGCRCSLLVPVASFSRLLSLNWTALNTILSRLVEYLVGLHGRWGDRAIDCTYDIIRGLDK